MASQSAEGLVGPGPSEGSIGAIGSEGGRGVCRGRELILIIILNSRGGRGCGVSGRGDMTRGFALCSPYREWVISGRLRPFAFCSF